MLDNDHFFLLGDSAEGAGDFAAAKDAFEQGIARGEPGCLGRLARMFDVGLGVAIDKRRAMRLHLTEWRQCGYGQIANNIAILYREAGNHRGMFRWFSRAVEQGDHDCYLQLAQCYKYGLGEAQSDEMAVRCLAAVKSVPFVLDETFDEADAMLKEYRPRAV